jgi:alkaline phosphatase
MHDESNGNDMRIKQSRFWKWLLTLVLFITSACTPSLARVASPPQAGPATHVILLIGDGMGAWHVDAAAKYYQKPLAMMRLKHRGYMTTFMRDATMPRGPYADEHWEDGSRTGSYDASQGGFTPWQRPSNPAYPRLQYTDSAAAASAMLSGRKTVKHALNVEAEPKGYAPGDAAAIRYHRTIVDIAESMGLATGLVTSVNFNHATPSAAIVKTPYRKNHGEKARQLIESDVDVIMGAGHPMYDNDGTRRTPNFGSWSRNKGSYLDDIDGEGLYTRVAGGYKGRIFLETRADFDDLADGDDRFRGRVLPRAVFGLAQTASTLQFNRSRKAGIRTENGTDRLDSVPSLSVMTKGALAVLDRHPHGFWLLVEGGAIDWAGHANEMPRMLEELLDFDRAVEAVIQWVNDDTNDATWGNTLVIVAADHETGYLQPVGDYKGEAVINAACWNIDCSGWSHHTNSLVPIYAQGVGAENLDVLTDGDFHDNTDIFYTMLRALKR